MSKNLISISTTNMLTATAGLTKVQKGTLLECILALKVGSQLPELDPVLQLRLDLIKAEMELKSQIRRDAVNTRYKTTNGTNGTKVTNGTNATKLQSVQSVQTDLQHIENKQLNISQSSKKSVLEEEERVGSNNNINNNNIFLTSTEENIKEEVKEEKQEKKKRKKEEPKVEETQDLFADQNPRVGMKRGQMKIIDGKKVYKRSEGVFFIAPTIEEVQDIISMKKYDINAADFIEYYESYDWHMSNGMPIKSWKQCLITWQKLRNKPTTKRGVDYANMKQSDIHCETIQHIDPNAELNF